MLKKLKINKFTQKITKICTFFKIDLSFAVVLMVAFLLGEIKFYVCYILFMLLHELSHLFVAKKLGYLPSKIRVGVFGAKLEGDDDFTLRDEIKIVLAGPLFNLIIVVFCYLSFWFNPESYEFLYDVLIANWTLLIFNALPIFPLDMGRFLLASLSLKIDRLKATKLVKRFSVALILLLFLIYIISAFNNLNFSLGFVCVNLMSLCLTSSKDTSYKRQLFVKRKFKKLTSGLPEKNIYVSENLPNYSLFKFIDDSHYINFVFLSSTLEETGRMTEVELYKSLNMLD